MGRAEPPAASVAERSLTPCPRFPHPPTRSCAAGKYYYLPNASDAAIAAATSSAMSEAKGM